MTDEVKNKTVEDVQRNMEASKTSIENSITHMDNQMKKINRLMNHQLKNFKEAQKRFFKFDEAKTICFWLSIISNFALLGIFIYLMLQK